MYLLADRRNIFNVCLFCGEHCYINYMIKLTLNLFFLPQVVARKRAKELLHQTQVSKITGNSEARIEIPAMPHLRFPPESQVCLSCNTIFIRVEPFHLYVCMFCFCVKDCRHFVLTVYQLVVQAGEAAI